MFSEKAKIPEEFTEDNFEEYKKQKVEIENWKKTK